MRKVRDYQLKNPWKETDRNWIRATYYTGVMALYRVTGDKEILDQAIRWCEKHNWAEGDERERANKKTCGQTYLELYFLDPVPERIAAIRARLLIVQPAIDGVTRLINAVAGGGKLRWIEVAPA